MDIVERFVQKINEDVSLSKERDYTFRRKAKIKEQQRRREIYRNRHYFPTMPNKKTDKSGEEYYIEGSKGEVKRHLKRISNRKVRKARLLKDGSHYKKVYNLPWMWF